MVIRNNPNFNSYLPQEDHVSFTPEAKYLWIKLIPDVKAIMLEGRDKINRSNNMSNSNKYNDLVTK